MAFKMKGPLFFKSALKKYASPAKDTDPHTGKNPDHEAHGKKGTTVGEKLKAAGTAVWKNIGKGQGSLSLSEHIASTYKEEKRKSRVKRGHKAPGPQGFKSEAQYKAHQSGDPKWRDV
jgi:hypothetical protein